MTDWFVNNVPDDLATAFDEAIKGVYASRSEALRDLARQFVKRQQASVEVLARLEKEGPK